MNKELTKIYHLGGLYEVGKNCYCIEHEDEILMFDCGMKMPGKKAYGIEVIIPNFKHVLDNISKFKGLVITHGHEDHIGAIPYLLKQLENRILVIYAPVVAREFIKKKLSYNKISADQIQFMDVDEKFELRTKHFIINSYINVHSIPDAYGYNIQTPNGVITTTGDWRLDLSPLGPITEFHKITRPDNTKCTLLLSDSTNSLVEGFTVSETNVLESIERIFSNTKGRLIITTFASNVFRVQKLVQLGIKYNRKILIFGKSMEKGIKISIKLGYLNISNFKSVFIKQNDSLNYPPSKILILCTGSQGEPLSALQRISEGKHKSTHIKAGDTIVFSSKPIPGNYLSVQVMQNRLLRLGGIILENNFLNLTHTSGHATQKEQQLLFALLKPRYFIPIHGEYNMLIQHTKTASKMGVPIENSFVCKNGDVIALDNGRAFRHGVVTASDVYINGRDLSSSDSELINTRSVLINNGLIGIIFVLNPSANKMEQMPLIISRGTFYVKRNTKLIYQLQQKIFKCAQQLFREGLKFSEIEENVIQLTKEFIYIRKRKDSYVVVSKLIVKK